MPGSCFGVPDVQDMKLIIKKVHLSVDACVFASFGMKATPELFVFKAFQYLHFLPRLHLQSARLTSSWMRTESVL